MGTCIDLFPIDQAVQLKYSSVKISLDALKYEESGWEVIRYIKIVAFLMGLHDGFTKFLLFLSLRQQV